MYLKSLQINGFKSFAKKTDLDFTTNISAIVGPNGSGKSNVAEAFRFALGEQSMKNMRGKKGEDLIFSGRSGRLNRAGVKVVFDNQDHGLDIDFDQVEMERVVFRDGVNEYLLNKNKVRAKDVLELLGSANIGSSSHHIISQGEADKILAVSPKERKTILEDALGLKPFIIKKNESERKLLKVEENLKEVKIKQRVNKPRIKFLAREVEKAERVKAQKIELENLYRLFFPQKKRVSKKLNKINEKKETVQEEHDKLETKIIQKRADLNQIKTSGQGEIKKDERLLKLEVELTELAAQKSQEQGELAKLEYELQQLEQRQNNWERENSSQQKNEEIYNKKLEDILNILQEFFSEVNSKLAEKLLAYFGVRKNGQREKDFSEEDFIKIKADILETKKKLENILEREAIITKKMRILNSSSENSVEVFGQEIQIEILQLEKELGQILTQLQILENEKIQILRELEIYRREETFVISIFGTEKLSGFLNPQTGAVSSSEELNLVEKIQRIRILLENSGGGVSPELVQEYEFLVKNQEFVQQEVTDLEDSKNDLEKIIIEITDEIEKRFRVGVERINKEFSKFFTTLFTGGRAEIFLIKILLKNKDDELKDKMEEFELGLDIKVSLPNKKITGLSMLSGGERSLVSIALLFAMSAINPPPFIILDETDAALDEANSKRYGDMIEKLAEHSQLILITHNRETMSRAGILYGVTMGADGVSRLLSVSLAEAEKVAK